MTKVVPKPLDVSSLPTLPRQRHLFVFLRLYIALRKDVTSKQQHKLCRVKGNYAYWKFNLYLGHQKSYHLLHHLLDEIVDLGMVLPLRGNKSTATENAACHLHTLQPSPTATVPKLGAQVTLNTVAGNQSDRGTQRHGNGTGDGAARDTAAQAGMTKDRKSWKNDKATDPPPQKKKKHCRRCCCQQPRRLSGLPV